MNSKATITITAPMMFLAVEDAISAHANDLGGRSRFTESAFRLLPYESAPFLERRSAPYAFKVQRDRIMQTFTLNRTLFAHGDGAASGFVRAGSARKPVVRIVIGFGAQRVVLPCKRASTDRLHQGGRFEVGMSRSTHNPATLMTTRSRLRAVPTAAR